MDNLIRIKQLELRLHNLLNRPTSIEFYEQSEYSSKINDIITNIFERIIELTKNYADIRKINIFVYYIENDKNTYELLSQKYNLTRQRMLQLRERGEKSFLKLYSKHKNDEELSCYINCIYDIFESLSDGEILGLLICECVELSRRKIDFFIKFLFNKSFLPRLDELRKANALSLKENNKQEKILSKKREIVEALLSKTCFPADFAGMPSAPIKKYEGDVKLEYYETVKMKLEKLSPCINFVEYPDIIYYTSTQTEHRPNFFVVTEEGKCILLVIVAIERMSLFYNVNRFNELHNF